MSIPTRIAVLGGGLTGLAAAHRLVELRGDRPLEIHLYEAGSRWGGLVGTIERDGYLIDTGGDSFITNKPGALQLCQRLGLSDRLQATDTNHRGALVLFDGRPYPVPEGFQLLSPTAIGPVLRSPILSPWGKVRMAFEPFIPPRKGNGDESLASFVRRRFGNEVLERLVQPLVGGIYTSDPEKLSLRATMPRFLDMEQKYGSLLRAMRQAKSALVEDTASTGARYGLFAGLRGGMQELIDTLVARIAPHVTMHLHTAVDCVERWDAPSRYRLRFRVAQATPPDAFDHVISTLPTARSAALFENVDPQLATSLRDIEYASSTIVVTGHDLADIAHPLNAFGLVIPHRERRRILAVSFNTRKFPNRAPAGRTLLRTFVGGAMQPELAELDDAATVQLVREELAATLGVQGEPDFAIVVRYPRAMPQYHLGHCDRVAVIERQVAAHPGLHLAGNAYRGVGIPDAIHSGEQAAERVLSHATSLN
ncbi:MAG TPA: protoporphyrinogen oxidase [Planctomycetaceae bacterium]|nr:protoporphyrinogen oxidase [Planctomycetaceae bacterium]